MCCFCKYLSVQDFVHVIDCYRFDINPTYAEITRRMILLLSLLSYTIVRLSIDIEVIFYLRNINRENRHDHLSVR